MMGYGAGLGFGWLWMIGGLLLLIGVVVLIVWLVGRVAPATPSQSAPAQRPAGQDALEVLRMRFARGEITKDEYLAAKQVLEADR